MRWAEYLTRTVEGRTRARHVKPRPELEKVRREVGEYERFPDLVGQVTEVSEARPVTPPGSAGDAGSRAFWYHFVTRWLISSW